MYINFQQKNKKRVCKYVCIKAHTECLSSPCIRPLTKEIYDTPFTDHSTLYVQPTPQCVSKKIIPPSEFQQKTNAHTFYFSVYSHSKLVLTYPIGIQLNVYTRF